MTVTELIEGMLDLLDAPEKWARHHSAYDAEGMEVTWGSDQAASWCLVGALARVANKYSDMGAYNDGHHFLRRRSFNEYGTSEIPRVNDTKLRDYEDMRSFLKRALLEAEELNT